MTNYVKQFWGPGKYTLCADSNILNWEFTSKSICEVISPLHAMRWYDSALGKSSRFVPKKDVEYIALTKVLPTSHRSIGIFGGIDGSFESYLIHGDCSSSEKGFYSLIQSNAIPQLNGDVAVQSDGKEPNRLDVLYRPRKAGVEIDVEFSGDSPGRVLRALASAYERRLSEHRSASMTKEEKILEGLDTIMGY